jgi:hypothetical protein
MLALSEEEWKEVPMQRIIVLMFLLLLGCIVAWGQGKMKLTTSKPAYAYGDTIEIRMCVWNDSTVPFSLTLESGSFPFWILDTVSMGMWDGFSNYKLIFNPGNARTWVWRVAPRDLGIPNTNSRHSLIGSCARLFDSTSFDAPLYRGGPIYVIFRPGVANTDIARLRDSLHATVTLSYPDSGGTLEGWQVDGFQIDSLAQALKGDSRVKDAGTERWLPSPSQLLVTSAGFQNLNPTGFMLYQNYPNPFNPTTTIRYALPQRSQVTLAVFNTLGQQVATLVNEIQGPGYHEIHFDGSGLASGVYFYRFRAGGFAETKRLLILR